MKVKELIAILQAVDLEANVVFELGNCDAYKRMCAIFASENEEGLKCFRDMRFHSVEMKCNLPLANIILVQSYMNDEEFMKGFILEEEDQ